MGKKKQTSKKKHTEISSFNIMNFDIDNYYLFNVTKYSKFINSIEDFNLIKPNANEVDIINKEIENCKIKNITNTSNIQRIVTIKQEFYNRLKLMENKDLSGTNYSKNLSKILDYLKKQKEKITLKKLREYYEIFFGVKISVTTISRILKNHLNIRYLKTSLKNPKLDEENYIMMSFIFIRGILRSLSLKLNLIFVDETGFLLENNNYHSWRVPKEEIHAGPKIKAKQRLNLILGVSNSEVICYKFLKESVTSKTFIEFLSDLLKNIKIDEKQKIIIIMDNAKFHLTNEVIKFFSMNKIKGLTICPYKSDFNMIE